MDSCDRFRDIRAYLKRLRSLEVEFIKETEKPPRPARHHYRLNFEEPNKASRFGNLYTLFEHPRWHVDELDVLHRFKTLLQR